MNYIKVLCFGLMLSLGMNAFSYAATKKSTQSTKSTKKSTNSTKKTTKSTAEPKKEKVVFTDPLKTIIVNKTKPLFSITVKSNPTTGFSWVLKSYDPTLVTPVRRRFYKSTSTGLMGAPGYEKWVFRVKPAGFSVPQVTSINLIYMRPWDEEGAQVTNFKVVTNNANKTT